MPSLLGKIETAAITAAFAAFFVMASPAAAAVPDGGAFDAETALEATASENEAIDGAFVVATDDATYFRATVVSVGELADGEAALFDGPRPHTVTVRLTDGPKKGTVISLTDRGLPAEARGLEPGDGVVVYGHGDFASGGSYEIVDRYRLPSLLLMFVAFGVLVVFFSRWRGVGALIGTGVSLAVLVWLVVPAILGGADPIWATLRGAIVIAAVSIYLAHGFNRRTSVALLSTALTLGIALGLAELFVRLGHLSGFGTEEAFFLQAAGWEKISLRGLLLAGIVIGTMGVLDDITTGQTAVVGELRRADPRLSPRELYARSLIVGREHISSLVNTLVLAYVGAAFPLFLLFYTDQATPLWFKFNGEIVAEEFVRTVVGSISLVLAVPITTLLAIRFLRGEKTAGEVAIPHAH